MTENNEEMFPQIIEVNEQQKEAARELEALTYQEIFPGIIEIPHINGTLKVKVPPIGFDDYYTLVRKAKGERTRGLNAFELSSLFLDSFNNNFNNYGTRGRVVGLDELSSEGGKLLLTPKIVSPGDILRSERNFSYTGVVYIPFNISILGSNGGAFVFDFIDPDIKININELSLKARKEDGSVRFVPGEFIPRGDYISEDWEIQNEVRSLTSEEFKKDPLVIAILSKAGALDMSQINVKPQEVNYKSTFATRGNFHLFYNCPRKINFPYQAVVSMRQNNGHLYLDASNKSVGNKGFDAFSKMPLLAKGFLYCNAE